MDNAKSKQARNIMAIVHRVDRMETRLAEAGITVENRDGEIEVSGKTYAIRAALKAVGFKWIPGSKVWVYRLRTYSNFKMSHGGTRLQDCTVRRHPWPADWYPAACRALAGR